MARVVKVDLPDDSILATYVRAGDFVDCYSAACTDDLDAVAQRIMAFPGWVSGLMALRNQLVRPFGLKTKLPDGPRIGPFPLLERSDHEIILGADDSHLNFRLSIMVEEGRAYSGTWVQTHSVFGRVYLAAIMPFHILILRNAMGRA